MPPDPPSLPQLCLGMHIYMHIRHPCNSPSKNHGYRPAKATETFQLMVIYKVFWIEGLFPVMLIMDMMREMYPNS